VTAPALFIGVVSYAQTAFPISQGTEGLGHTVARTLTDSLGIETTVQINATDLDESGVNADRAAVQRSLTAELQAEARYSQYISRPAAFANSVRMAGRWLMRAKHNFSSPPPRMITRLLNIEASHLDLMRSGIASGAHNILILEDDAFSSNVEDLAEGLKGIIDSPRKRSFVNLSESFSVDELGVGHLLVPSAEFRWSGNEQRIMYHAKRPITNTVCAILYSREFLISLVQEMDALPVDPVLSIDWKLNVAVMNLFEANKIDGLECWWVEPAPITQMSMHS
jgi:hypothetical protein